MSPNSIQKAQARREFSAAWARAAENTADEGRRRLAAEVQRTARRLVVLESGTVGGSSKVDIDRARREFADDLQSTVQPNRPGTDLAATAAKSRRVALQLAELEAGDNGH